jgi:thiamine biosynthesis protein ThiI
VVIDIRHPDNAEEQPLGWPLRCKRCPFYALSVSKGWMTRQYLLYCDKAS